jgi:2-oxoglutarate dehydrogenase E2 component (dihydrolipoamide succinyltransferase)
VVEDAVAINIVVPQLGESVVEARVARWLKREGEAVAAGEPVVELETEKIDLEVGAEHAGVLASIKHPEGADVKVGDVLAVVDAGATAAAPAAEGGGAATPAPAAPAPAGAEPVAKDARDGQKATPTARKVAEAHDVALSAVAGSGDAGRITKKDVAGQIQSPSPVAAPPASAPQGPAPAAPGPPPLPPAKAAKPTAPVVAPAPPRAPGTRAETRERMSKRRLTIARNLVEAQRTAAMLTTFNEVDMTELMALRERRKQAFKERYGLGLGIASFFVKASVAALRAFPRLNAEIQGDEMVLKHYYDIGIAVGAPQGLVVPVIRNAEDLSFAGIEQAIREFAGKAQNGTLTLDDLKGGSFTITNGGVFGSMLSTPILNPPQVGILGLHKIEDRPVAIKGQVVIRPMMYVALSYDHRIVDGLEAVQFLVRVKELIEDPGQMLLEG